MAGMTIHCNPYMGTSTDGLKVVYIGQISLPPGAHAGPPGHNVITVPSTVLAAKYKLEPS